MACEQRSGAHQGKSRGWVWAPHPSLNRACGRRHAASHPACARPPQKQGGNQQCAAPAAPPAQAPPHPAPPARWRACRPRSARAAQRKWSGRGRRRQSSRRRPSRAASRTAPRTCRGSGGAPQGVRRSRKRWRKACHRPAPHTLLPQSLTRRWGASCVVLAAAVQVGPTSPRCSTHDR